MILSYYTLLYILLLTDLNSGLEGGFGDLAIEVLHILLSHLIHNSEDEVGVSPESVLTFIETLRRDFPHERVPVVLAPLLYKENQDITEDRLAKSLITIHMHLKMELVIARAYILLRRRGHATSTTIEIFQCYYF